MRADKNILNQNLNTLKKVKNTWIETVYVVLDQFMGDEAFYQNSIEDNFIIAEKLKNSEVANQYTAESLYREMRQKRQILETKIQAITMTEEAYKKAVSTMPLEKAIALSAKIHAEKQQLENEIKAYEKEFRTDETYLTLKNKIADAEKKYKQLPPTMSQDETVNFSNQIHADKMKLEELNKEFEDNVQVLSQKKSDATFLRENNQTALEALNALKLYPSELARKQTEELINIHTTLESIMNSRDNLVSLNRNATSSLKFNFQTDKQNLANFLENKNLQLEQYHNICLVLGENNIRNKMAVLISNYTQHPNSEISTKALALLKKLSSALQQLRAERASLVETAEEKNTQNHSSIRRGVVA